MCAELNALLPLGAITSLDGSRMLWMVLLLHPNLSSCLENYAEFGLPGVTVPVGYCKKCSCYSECTSYSSVCAELNVLLPLGAVGSLDISRTLWMALLFHPNLSPLVTF